MPGVILIATNFGNIINVYDWVELAFDGHKIIVIRTCDEIMHIDVPLN